MRRSFATVAILLASQMPVAGLTAQAVTPEMVSVELSNFKFSPSTLALQSGHLYRLHLVNAAGGVLPNSVPAALMLLPGSLMVGMAGLFLADLCRRLVESPAGARARRRVRSSV